MPIVVDGTDCEIDVVLVSPHRGVIAVEVKGGVISIEKGRWIQNGYPLSKSPTQQITKAKHNLMKRLRSTGVELEGMFVCHAVALPDVGSVPPVVSAPTPRQRPCSPNRNSNSPPWP